MNKYKSPGVYIEESQTTQPAMVAVATAVPAFLGYTQDATLVGQPARVVSLLEFERLFGGSPPMQIDLSVTKKTTESGALRAVEVALDGPSLFDPVPIELLHYAVKHYFANGGEPCWIYSLGACGDNRADDYIGGIAALEAITEPTLLVFPGAARLATAGDHESVVQAALESCLRTHDRFTIVDVRDALPGGAHDTVAKIITGFRTAVSPTHPEALRYGAAYWPYLRTSIPWITDEKSIRITSYAEERLMRDGIITSPDSNLTAAVSSQATAISEIAVRDNETAVYNAARDFAATQFVTLPPSAAIAGAYATTDRNRGVWKAPANIGLAMVSAPAIAATKEINDALNADPAGGRSINVIRNFAGRGIKVWGARTLAGNDNEYRYVPACRLALMIVESTEKAMASFVFENNDANTWPRIRTMIESFLFAQWRAGALQGRKPESAFFVKLGLGETMTADDILYGILRVQVGIALVRPAEFVTFTIEQKLPAS